MTNKKLSSFYFLKNIDPLLVHLGDLAESYPASDPHASIIRLRQYGEVLGRLVAQKFHIYIENEDVYFDLLQNLRSKDQIPSDILGGFNQLRVFGNNALHGFQGSSSDVRKNIQIAVQLGRWFVSIIDNRDKASTLENVLPQNIKEKLNKITVKAQTKKEIKKVSNDFIGQDLSGKNFSGKNLAGFDFSGANLYKANFKHTNLSNTVFDGADIRGADFTGSRGLQSFQLEYAFTDQNTRVSANLVKVTKVNKR